MSVNCICASEKMDNISTRRLVADYIKYRLDKAGLPWASCPSELITQNPGKVESTMRVLGDEFEQRYTQVFEEMCNQLHITPNNAQPTFVAIVNELYSDGVKWGRVVALFAFGGSLAAQCVQREMPDMVDSVLDWVTSYVDNHLKHWILEHGGWSGFVEFYEGRPERRDESPWPSLKTLCGYAVGALGVLTLGAILAQKS